MKTLKTIVGIICIVMAQQLSYGQITGSGKAVNDSTEQKNLKSSIVPQVGVDFGWESPYGAGLNAGILIYETLNFNIGAGLSLTGLKIGVGSRIYLLRNSRVSPMLGAYIYHSTGVKSVIVRVNEEEGKYKYNACNAAIINAGLRIKINELAYLTGCIGYSIPFEKTEAIYISGSNSEAVKSFANIISVGGISVTAGIVINLSKNFF